jgi:hypothetical protein
VNDTRLQKHLSLKARVLVLLMVLLVLSGVFAFASTLTLSQSDARSRSGQLNSIKISTLTIFENNLLIALVEFVPVLGPAFGVYTSFSTGLTLAAEAQTNTSYQQLHITGLELFLFLLITPIYWLEFFSYSLAVEESIAIIISIRNRDLVAREWKWLVASIIAVVVILLVSARLEVLLINVFGGA